MVISTHGYTGLDYVLLGGTAERVIRHAPCPVLVVRRQDGRPPEPKKILVPVDFSPASLDGLRYALRLARPFGARLTALHVEDLDEALVGAVPGITFGLAFCEASGKCLVRWSGTVAR
jgi:nucleotide-binding universal stress UspA family protein